MPNEPFDPTPYPRTPRQQSLVERARALAANFAQRAAEHDREGAFPHENFRELRASGFAALNVPCALGGEGADLLETVMVMEELGRGDGSTALAFTMHAQTVGHAVESGAWPQPLFERLCREAVERQVLVNAVASERDLGSPSRGGRPQTTAHPERDQTGAVAAWRINGRKTWASMSPTLDYAIVLVALEDGSNDTARLLVPMHRSSPAAVVVEECWDAMGMRATGSHDLVFTDMIVPADMLIARESQAKGPGGGSINAWFMLTVGAVYLGVAEAALDAACGFALTRVPSALGKTIADLESIQRQLGQAVWQMQEARLCLYHVAALWQTTKPRTPALSNLVAAAKVTATNNAIAAVDLCLRAVGGAGMSRSLPLERYYRDVRGGLYHPVNDDAAYVTFGKAALAASATAKTERIHSSATRSQENDGA